MLTKVVTSLLMISLILCCPDDKICRRCNLVGNGCALCDESYSLNGECQSLLPTETISGCISYADRNSKSAPINCQKCDFGYKTKFEKDVNICESCAIDRCAICAVTGVCLACKDGYQIALDDKKITKCVPRDIKDDHCLVITHDNIPLCFLCESGFALLSVGDLGGICVQSNVSGCMKVQWLDHSKCDTCHRGYYLNANHGCSVSYKNRYLLFIIGGIVILALVILTTVLYKCIRKRRSASSSNYRKI